MKKIVVAEILFRRMEKKGNSIEEQRCSHSRVLASSTTRWKALLLACSRVSGAERTEQRNGEVLGQ
jgi:hypothetical protein